MIYTSFGEFVFFLHFEFCETLFFCILQNQTVTDEILIVTQLSGGGFCPRYNFCIHQLDYIPAGYFIFFCDKITSLLFSKLVCLLIALHQINFHQQFSWLSKISAMGSLTAKYQSDVVNKSLK